MKITVEKQANCTARLRVEVPAETVTGERQRIVKAFSRQAKLPGFRPGKVPRTVIEKRFRGQISEELESQLVSKAFQEAIEQEKLRVLNAKNPEEATHHPDGTFSFSTELVLAPDFELPDYKGLTIEVPDRQIGEEDLDRELEQLRNHYADFNEITDRPLAAGDFAVIDYSSSFEGAPLEEALGQPAGQLGGGEAFWLKMDEESFLPGFAKNLEGASIDEEREFAVTLGEDFPAEALRGKDLDFKVKVTAVKEQILPELDDTFAAQVVPDKSLAELRDLIKAQLEQQLERNIQEAKVNQVVEKLSNAVEFEVPEEILRAETQGQADEIVERGINQGMSEEEIEAQQGEIFAAAGQRAKLNIKTDFILQEIAKAEEIAVTDGELAERIAAYAQQAKKPVKAFAKELQKSGRISGIRHNMLLSKTIDFLLDSAKVESVKEPTEESNE